MAQAGLPRPVGFGKEVHIDLKYVKDAEDNNFVVLSAVDTGSSYHVAALVKTRDSRYVAQKFLKMWVRHYGIPDCVVHDQGGEFESGSRSSWRSSPSTAGPRRPMRAGSWVLLNAMAES